MNGSDRHAARWLIRALALLCAAGAALAQAALPATALRDGLPSLAPMLAGVTPAVVNVSVVQRSPQAENPLLRDPFFRRFFGLPDQDEAQVAAGSGVIVDARNGYVLSNHHVIKDASQVFVTLKDKRRLSARVVGSDAGTDIALLKVQADKLAQLPLGDADALEVGDFVVAIGNPFGIGQTVTSGIVSALGRSGIASEGYEDFIQTDAPINPGNSGGALVNLRGELVGINTAIIGPSGGNVGIGFAVPVNMARAVMAQLIRFGEVRRGYLGVSMQDLSPDLAASLGVEATDGAVIAEVKPGSPAAREDLRVGDVVVGLSGRRVRGASELRARLGVVPAGETVALQILRGRETRTVSVRVAEVEARHVGTGRTLPELAGAELADASAEPEGRRGGVLVTAVRADTPAFHHGLRPGDVIIGVNRQRVRSIDELAVRLRARGGRLALNTLRGDFLLTIVIR